MRLGSAIAAAIVLVCELATNANCLALMERARNSDDLRKSYQELPLDSTDRIAEPALKNAHHIFGKWRYFDAIVGGRGLTMMVDTALECSAPVLLNETELMGLGYTVRAEATLTVNHAPLQAVQPSCKEESRKRPLRKARVRTRGPSSGGRSRTTRLSDPLPRAYSPNQKRPARHGDAVDPTVAREHGLCCARGQSMLRQGIFPATTSEECFAGGTTGRKSRRESRDDPNADCGGDGGLGGIALPRSARAVASSPQGVHPQRDRVP